MPDFIPCLNASTIRPAPVLEQIRMAAAAGYAAIELWHSDLDAHLARGGTLAEVRHALDDHQLTVPTTIYLAGWFETTAIEHAQALDVCRRKLEQAAAVGALYAIAGPPAGYADHELGGRNYRELLEIGAEYNVRPAMEFLGFVDELNTIEDALDIVNRAGHPHGSVVIDPFHIYRGGGSPTAIKLLRGDQIAIFHFNDMPDTPERTKTHDADRVYPGDGVLDLAAELQLAHNTGYRRWLSLELFREDLWASDLQTVAKTGLEKMRRVVTAAGFTI